MTFTNILLIIIAIAISIIAIRVTFTFDINKYLESRKDDIKKQIMNHCTHMYAENTDDGIKIESAFISPSWTTQWICKKCRLTVYHIDSNEENRRMKQLLENPSDYIKQEKKFQKLLKKGGYL